VQVSPLASVAATAADTGARNPAVLPEFVKQFSWIVPANDLGRWSNSWEDIELPAALQEATAKRQLHFRAGRYCALRALEALEGRLVTTVLPQTAGGAPLWPEGVTGSITHTDGFVSAAVARTSQVEALGIDTERIMSVDRAARVSAAIAWPSELAHMRAIGFDRLEALTLVFSAKEAIFKCLYRKIGRIFDYRDVRIVAAVLHPGTFTARIVQTLSPDFPAQTLLHGRFEINGSWVHTGMVLSSGPPPSMSALETDEISRR
jgi:enterobactin synthetase component D